MTRRDLRKPYPFHDAERTPAPAPRKPYNRHSLRHHMRAWLARVRRTLGV